MLKHTKTFIRKQANLWDSLKENSNAVLGTGLGGLGTYTIAKAFGASTPWALGLGLAGAAAGGYGGSKLDKNKPQSEVQYRIDPQTAGQIASAYKNFTGRPPRNGMSAAEQLSDINARMLHASKYTGGILTPEQIETAKAYFNNKPDILKTMLDQNRFISGLGKGSALVDPNRYVPAFNGEYLSSEEWRILDDLLADEPGIVKKLRKHIDYVHTVNSPGVVGFSRYFDE